MTLSGGGALVARPGELRRGIEPGQADDPEYGKGAYQPAPVRSEDVVADLAHLGTSAAAPAAQPAPRVPAPPPDGGAGKRPRPVAADAGGDGAAPPPGIPAALQVQRSPRAGEMLWSPTKGPRNVDMGGKPVAYHSSQQQQINFQLRTNVISAEDGLSTAHEQLITLSRERPKAMTEKQKAAFDFLVEHEHGMKWTSPSGFATSDLTQQLGLRVDHDTFHELVKKQVPDTAFFKPCLQEFAREPDDDVKMPRRRWEQRKDQLATLAPICVRGPAPLTSVDLPGIITQYYEYLHTDVLGFTRQELATTDQRLSELWQEIESVEAIRYRSQEDGQLMKCRECHIRKAELLREVCDIFHKRVEMVKGGQDDTGSFAENLARFQREARVVCEEYKENKDQMLEDVTHDLKALQQGHQQEVGKHHEALDAYQRDTDVLYAQIKANQRQHEDVWRKIEEHMRDLQKLGEERTQLVKRQLEAKEKEEQRRSRFTEYCDIQREHLLGMQHLKEQALCCCKLGEDACKYVKEMEVLLEEKNVDEAVALLTLEEQQRYLEHYRHFVKSAGDLHARLEQRMQNISRNMRTNEIHLELAEDAYDPDGEKYIEAKRMLEAEHSNIQKLLDSVWAHLRQATDDFADTDADLAAAGVDFVPPMIELQGWQAQRKEAAVTKTKKFVASEQDQVETDQTSIRRLNMVMKEQTEVAKARPVTKKFKKGVAGSMPSPAASARIAADGSGRAGAMR